MSTGNHAGERVHISRRGLLRAGLVGSAAWIAPGLGGARALGQVPSGQGPKVRGNVSCPDYHYAHMNGMHYYYAVEYIHDPSATPICEALPISYGLTSAVELQVGCDCSGVLCPDCVPSSRFKGVPPSPQAMASSLPPVPGKSLPLLHSGGPHKPKTYNHDLQKRLHKPDPKVVGLPRFLREDDALDPQTGEGTCPFQIVDGYPKFVQTDHGEQNRLRVWLLWVAPPIVQPPKPQFPPIYVGIGQQLEQSKNDNPDDLFMPTVSMSGKYRVLKHIEFENVDGDIQHVEVYFHVLKHV